MPALSVAPMDFELSEQQRAIKDTARAFAHGEMMPLARQWDEEEVFPADTLRQAAALGFGGIYVSSDLRLGALQARRGADFRRAGAGLSVDRRLHLDPQHGRMDDRRLWRRRPARAPAARSLQHGEICQLLPYRARLRVGRRKTENPR